MTDTTHAQASEPGVLPPMSPTIAKVVAALVEVGPKLDHVAKVKWNDHFKSRFADLPAVIDVYRPVLAAAGLVLTQRELHATGGVRLQTVLFHESGEWVADGGPFRRSVKDDPQAAGSALTYLRRQAATALLGIAQADDDAAAASKPAKAKAPTVALATSQERDALQARINALPDELAKQIGERLRGSGVVWTALSKAQLKEVTKWAAECEDLA